MPTSVIAFTDSNWEQLYRIMATLVPSLPLSSDTNGHRHTIRHYIGNHSYTNRKVAPVNLSRAICLAASLQYEGVKGGYPAK